MGDRALRPLPPTKVAFNGQEFPSVIDNSAGVTVTWKRRNRLSTQVLTPQASDEPPEDGTQYYVEHGPAVFKVTTLLGTGTSGVFDFAFSGPNTFAIYAVKDGKRSARLELTANVLYGNGVIASGSFAQLQMVAPSAQFAIGAEGSPADLGIYWTFAGSGGGALSGLTVSAPTASALVQMEGTGGFPTLTVAPPEGYLTTTPTVNGYGGLTTLTLSPVSGALDTIANVIASGSVADLYLIEPTADGEVPTTTNAYGDLADMTIIAPEASAAGSADSNAYGSLADLTILPPAAYGEIPIQGSGNLAGLTIVPPNASAPAPVDGPLYTAQAYAEVITTYKAPQRFAQTYLEVVRPLPPNIPTFASYIEAIGDIHGLSADMTYLECVVQDFPVANPYVTYIELVALRDGTRTYMNYVETVADCSSVREWVCYLEIVGA